MRNSKAEAAWKWWCRGLASTGFVVLLLTEGLQGQIGFYLLLVGLFFGPEAIEGQLRINERRDR